MEHELLPQAKRSVFILLPSDLIPRSLILHH